MRIEFHRLALKEFDDACTWYKERSPATADRFKDAVEKAILRVSQGPDSLPKLTGAYRWVRVARFQYILVFQQRSHDQVVIAAVAHTSRRPGYWRRRMQQTE